MSGPDESGGRVDLSRVWLPSIVATIAEVLPANEVACTLRLVDRVSSMTLKEQHNTVCLSQPIPRHAFPALLAHLLSAPGVTRDLSLQQRRKLVSLAAASGDVGYLEGMTAAAGVVPSSAALGAAAAANQLGACRWLLDRGCSLYDSGRNGEEALTLAAAAGQRAACEWLLGHGAQVMHSAVVAAAEGGHVEVVEWLRGLMPPRAELPDFVSWFPVKLAKSVATVCDLSTLQRWWQRLRLSVQWPPPVLAAAAASPTPDWREKLSWLAAEGVSTSFAGVDAATLPDGVARLGWLAETFGYQPDHDCLHAAVGATSGSLETVRWLLQRLPPPQQQQQQQPVQPEPRFALRSAAKLQLLKDAGYSIIPTPAVFEDALRAGSEDVAAWLWEEARAQGTQLPLIAGLFANAATSGSVRVMAWLRECGCPFDEKAWDYLNYTCYRRRGLIDGGGAVGVGCEVALVWLAEQGCPMPSNGGPFITAARSGDLHTLEALRRLGVPFGPRGATAFDQGVGRSALPLPLLQWFVAAGFPVIWADALKALEKRGDYQGEEVRAWLEAQQRAAAGEDQGGGVAALQGLWAPTRKRD